MRTDMMLEVALRARVPVESGLSGSVLMYDLIARCERNEELFLDVVDATLSLVPEKTSTLARIFLDAGSVWTVSREGDSLTRRVDSTAQEQIEALASPQDESSAELAEAWECAYGRAPNPSDVWDHSIKAIEAALWPIVLPQNRKATLGTIEKALQAKPSKWTFGLESNSIGGVETLHALLKLVWPNPDRHGTGESRTPSQDEAEAVLHTAITIVQWVRGGLLRPADIGPE
ncbi:hypothetical protein [Corynebacterium stationis]|uniref:hypothetical protein n=1 Tax=Corynebacterium stationis TaxID=1705 RepID=UPI00261F7266|nr:hypothetical protein [Corynebacterium stationis]